MIQNTSTDNGYSVFHHEGNNWKPTRDEEYSNLEVIHSYCLGFSNKVR